jgi:co-chaperonin GroES (HSP10)
MGSMSSIRPLADNVKVKLDPDNKHGFKAAGEQGPTSKESGILVALPEGMSWLGYHSFAFEASLGDKSLLDAILKFYGTLKGKRVYWESFQDSGRRIKEGDDEFVLLKLTDIIAYSDADVKAKTMTDIRRGGSFKA